MHYAHILDPKTVGVINTHVKMVHSEYQEISSLSVLLKMFSVKSHSLPRYRNNFFIYSDFTFTHNLELWGHGLP